MTVTAGAFTVPVPDAYISVERIPGQLVLDAQIVPVPTRRVQQRIEQRLLRVDGVSEVTADAMGGFRITIANGLFDLDQVADAVHEEVRMTVTNELPQLVRVRAQQADQQGWWLIETDHRHASRKLLDLLADALHPSQFSVATEATRYSDGGYNILVWATTYWTQSSVEARAQAVINEYYAQA